MSGRRAELARLEAAGWTVLVDSPWPRMAERLRAVARAVLWTALRPAGRPR